jgi:signal peptidase I
LVEARFYLGLAGLFLSLTTIWLALWAIVPAVGWSWSSVVITSGSMLPSIAPGDVVVAAPDDGHGLAPGTVVVFHDPARPGLVTHRIVAVNDDGTYQTKGDANRVNDSTLLTPGQVVGVGRIMVPLVGLPAMWAWSEDWINVGWSAIVVIMAIWSTRFALLDKYDPWPTEAVVDHSRSGRHRRAGRPVRLHRGRHRAPSALARSRRGTGDTYA